MKNMIKKILLRFFAAVMRNDKALVIYYHDIGTDYTKMGTPSDLFWAHIAAAKNAGWTFSPVFRPGSQKQLTLCFDDGFRGIWTEREKFVKEGIRPIVFIAVDLVGSPGYLNWDEILALQNIGFVFQSHTWSHRPLTEVPNAELVHELADAKRSLSERLGHEVTMLCFPCGLFNERVLKACVDAGYTTLWGSFPGGMPLPFCGTNVFPRNLVQAFTIGDFMSVLRGGLFPLVKRYVAQHFHAKEN